MTPLAPLLEAFFTDRLQRQRQASPHTIAAYRDSFRLFLRFAQKKLGKAPSHLLLDDLDAPLIGAFLEALEKERKCSVRTRNARLAAIHSFFRYSALQEPAHAARIQQILAIPHKRFDRALISFLTHTEVEALLAAPDRSTWFGRRDHALLLVAAQTGLRVSELTGLHIEDVVLGTGPHVRCRGKGRKDRCTPLTRQAATVLRAWVQERRADPAAPVFANRHGGRLSRDAVERLIDRHAATAARACPSLASKHVSPHVLRHSNAVHLMQAGVDRSVIALWLGHESIETTQMYLDADLAIKERALARVAPLPAGVRRFRPGDHLLAFLDGL